MSNSNILEARGLSKAFGGVMAVANVNLAVGAGSLQAIIGPNGAGKTTLFNLLTGRLRSDSGHVFFKERDITRVPPYGMTSLGIGRTFQITAVFPRLTVLENIQVALFSRKGRKWDFFTPARRLYVREAEAIANEVGLSGQEMMLAGQVAHGNRKRLELGIALAQEPELLLLDEPTAGSPPAERMEVVKFIEQRVRQRGISLLFIEHDMDVVFSIADKVTVLHQGEVIAEGSPGTIRANEEVRAIYLGEEEGLPVVDASRT